MAIIKPDAVVHGKTDEIIMKVRETTLPFRLSSCLVWWKNRGAASASCSSVLGEKKAAKAF